MASVICTTFENDEQLFTRGACFVLALVLHDKSCWELVEICRQHDVDCHVLVCRPDGMYLDIRGYQTEDELRQRWGRGIDICPADYNEVLFNWTDPFGFDESYKRAQEIASDLIHGNYTPS